MPKHPPGQHTQPHGGGRHPLFPSINYSKCGFRRRRRGSFFLYPFFSKALPPTDCTRLDFASAPTVRDWIALPRSTVHGWISARNRRPVVCPTLFRPRFASGFLCSGPPSGGRALTSLSVRNVRLIEIMAMEESACLIHFIKR